MPENAPDIASARRGVPADDLVLPPMDLAAVARSRASPRGPAVVGAGDLLGAARVAAPRSAALAAPMPRRPAPTLDQLVRIFRGLCRAANDNRVRITVWSAILLLLLTHVAAVRIAPEMERVIEVHPPSAPGRMISAL